MKRQSPLDAFKIILFVANVAPSRCSLLALVFTLLTYFHTLKNARILLVANTSELGTSTLAAAFALFVSLIRYPGILLNNRPSSRSTPSCSGSPSVSSSSRVVPGARRRPAASPSQSVLGCCGYFSPFVEATVSATCYSRSILPGCNQQFLEFQEKASTRWYIVSFGLVPVHIATMVAGLLCSNHVTYRFGKGMMPKACRLSREAMAVMMEQYVSQLADQYSADAAAHMIANNSGNTNTSSSPSAQYGQRHTRGTGSGLSGLGSGSGSGCGGYAQMPPNPFSPNPTPAASASDLNLAGPRPHEDGDEEGDGYSYGYGGVEEGDERGAGAGQYTKYELLDIGAARF
ncbi:hypothetical protein B0H16DRAFT_1900255 [Mycena metata]|uniref:Uncharacterized protein n=1 Tax=Mycena metata TaxID=1033252 RepID=A0AAD7H5N0_9AGAR|nr:hypothetical protein B0H16DRAFT_1900255 [Mycena metata]